MKNILIILNIVIAGIIVSSCEKDITIDNGPVEEQLVIEAWINNNEGPVVLVSKTYPSYGSINFLELIDSSYLENAIVTVSNQSGQTVQLKEARTTDLTPRQLEDFGMLFQTQPSYATIFPIPVYIDTTNTIIGQEFGTYTLNVTYKDKSISAVTTIPKQYTLDSLSYKAKANSSDLVTVNFNLSIPAVAGNYIRYASKRNNEPFYYPERSGATWSDDIFAGSGSITIPVERGYPDSTNVDIDDFGYFEVGDTVTVYWRNIDKDSYDFWYSLDNDGGDTPFSSPVKAETNIVGGQGLWAGYNISFETVIID